MTLVDWTYWLYFDWTVVLEYNTLVTLELNHLANSARVNKIVRNRNSHKLRPPTLTG